MALNITTMTVTATTILSVAGRWDDTLPGSVHSVQLKLTSNLRDPFQ